MGLKGANVAFSLQPHMELVCVRKGIPLDSCCLAAEHCVYQHREDIAVHRNATRVRHVVDNWRTVAGSQVVMPDLSMARKSRASYQWVPQKCPCHCDEYPSLLRWGALVHVHRAHHHAYVATLILHHLQWLESREGSASAWPATMTCLH